jgi:ribosome-binding factor A
MANRRLQKMAHVIRDSVSRTVSQRLSDPRITGLISVTEVVISPDIKNATVYLSIMAANDEAKTRAFQGIRSAAGVIQYHLGRELVSRFCPHLRFELDTKMQQTLRTLEMIERAAEEYKDHDRNDDSGDGNHDENRDSTSQQP